MLGIYVVLVDQTLLLIISLHYLIINLRGFTMTCHLFLTYTLLSFQEKF